MDVKTIGLIFLGSFLIQASIFGVAADKVPDKDGEVPKLVKEGNHLEETAAVRGLSLKNMLLQKRSIKEDIKESRKKHAGKVQTRQEDIGCYISGGTLYCDGKEDIKESRQKRKVQTRQEDKPCSIKINGVCWSGKVDMKENRQKRAGKVQTRQEDEPCSIKINGVCWSGKVDMKENRQKRAGPGCYISGGTLYCNGKEDIKESRQKRAGKAQTRQKGCGWNCGWCMHGICLDGKEDIEESRQKRAGPGCYISGGTLYCNGKEDIKESRQKRAGKAQTRQKGCGWNCGWCMHGMCLDGKLSQ